jgi:type II secretory pathway pseudopilin PulG
VTLFETVIALSVVGVLAALIVPTIRWINLRQRESERRVAAQEEVRNVVERAAMLPWDELRQEVVAGWKVSSNIENRLPDPRLKVTVDDQPDAAPPARRLHVELTWKAGAEQSSAPIRLTAWFHPRGESR